MKLTAFAVSACVLSALSLSAQSAGSQDSTVHLNQIQVIGTHNSYNGGFAPSEAKWLQSKNPDAYSKLEYSHPPLPAQFDGGARQIEIDIASDPQGGRYAHPRIVDLTKEAGLPADPDFDPQHLMDKPGLKVLHVVDINQRSTCQPLVACLQQVRDWSRAHPRHVPIFVLIENKSGMTRSIANAVEAPQFTAADFDELDLEIRSVFKPAEMIVPDQVRGTYPTLEAAVLAGNWPTLAESRGKVVFLMDQKKSGPIYTAGHPSLKGRVLFTNATPGDPDAAFIEQNSGTPDAINALVKRGYLVRARSDSDTDNGRTGDTHRRDELLGSGAQFISTDYPSSEPSKWTKYSVALPGGLAARCNPVNAPKSCVDSLIEAGTKQ
ncbi:MAG: phosphatidylinositol-specific phospholipase C1-like protein [Janthinobacterium lividum]